VVKRLIEVYLENRSVDERFIDTVRRLGHTPFKERVYADRQPGKQKVEA
jgi:sulfite reductase (NADPH) hemoprotein beta-component